MLGSKHPLYVKRFFSDRERFSSAVNRMDSYAPQTHGMPAYLLLTIAILLWTSNWIAGKFLAAHFPPATLAFLRWAIALCVISPYVAPRLWRQRELIRVHWRALVVLGLLGGGLHSVLQYWALHYTAAINGPILNCLTPIVILFLSTVILKTALRAQALIGAFIAFAGAFAVITRLDPGVIGALQFNAGDLLILGAVVLLAGFTIALRLRPRELEPLSFLACFALVGQVPVGLISLVEYLQGSTWRLTPESVGGLLYIALFPALLGYLLWNQGVARIGSEKAGMFMYLNPLFGSLLSVAILGEAFEFHHAVGIVLVLAGVAISQRTPS